MDESVDIRNLADRGGRRRVADRRRSSTPGHFPERRSQRLRRSGVDRRALHRQNFRQRKERRRAFRRKFSS